MRIWITGIAGFLGSHLADALLREGHEVFGNDSLIGGNEENVPSAIRAIKGWVNVDCCDTQLMRDWILVPGGIDVLYHCAALAHEGLSVFSPSLIADNILGTSASVFSAAIAAGVKRIVFCSSMARYGNSDLLEFSLDGTVRATNFPFHEGIPTRPVDPYGICKVAAEDLLKMLCHTHGVEYVIAVPHNIYGPRQKYDDPFRNVAAIMTNRMLQGLPPIIYGDGQQKRCFSYIDDVVPSLVKMATQSNVVGETINIGPDEMACTINELAAYLTACTDFKGEPIYVPARPAEVRFATCSSDKARRLLDYKTETPLHIGMKKLVEFIRERGPKPFDYYLPIEIQSNLTPKTWTDRLI